MQRGRSTEKKKRRGGRGSVGEEEEEGEGEAWERPSGREPPGGGRSGTGGDSF